MGHFRFHRGLRLLVPAHFKFVFADAIPIGSEYFTLLARYNPDTQHPRLGLTIAKNRVRFAVQRNRIKRIVRESFRQHQDQLPNVDIIFMGKQPLTEASNEVIRQQVDKAWLRLNKKLAKINAQE